ncbi:MAG: hypothetical protein EHM41_24185 [Chloroflexi bacterium]|nr:MAG: hypothetical protein EHM41_24185 [Chloroflexota bacterium]
MRMDAGEKLLTWKEARVDHAASLYHCHPGETLTLFTRVSISEPDLKFRLQVSVPAGMELLDYKTLNQPAGTIPAIAQGNGTCYLIWDEKREPLSSTRFEYQAKVRVLVASEDKTLESRAVLTFDGFDAGQICEEELVAIHVQAKSKLLKYLPSIYEDDELMGRFLMLFESFLAPLDSQIKGQADYLDPFLAPVEFIPWLASWTDMKIDEELPPENKRSLLKVSASLLRARGTRKALKEYLEIYTGGKAEIREHFSQNFQLGKDAKLGQDIALGMDNVPQTFTVKLYLPPLPEELDEDERSRQMLNYERKMRAIIEAEKPIHTGYKLLIQTGPRA